MARVSAKVAGTARQSCPPRSLPSKLSRVDAWADRECSDCHKTFDVERHAARMAPDSPLFVAPDEKPFAVMDEQGAVHLSALRQGNAGRTSLGGKQFP